MLGHFITVYMDHNDLTYDSFTIKIVIRWHLLLKEYGPNIKYGKGPDNDTVVALSRFLLINYNVKETDIKK